MTDIDLKEVALQGIITADDFDSNGKPVRFVLLTDDENTYRLELGTKNQDVLLLQLNRSKVVLRGAIHFDGKYNVITVNELKKLPYSGRVFNLAE